MHREIAPLTIVMNDKPESGNGVLLVVPDRAVSKSEAQRLMERVSLPYKTGIIAGHYPDMFHVDEFTNSLAAVCEVEKLKRLSLLGLGVGAALVQAFAIENQRLVRRVVLVNGTTRLAPSHITRLIDLIERRLPLGLPLRPLSRAFDSRPQLHRLRCPVLVVLSPDASAFERTQAEILSQTIPNCWLEVLRDRFDHHSEILSTELEKLLEEFGGVATKKPQKNLANA